MFITAPIWPCWRRAIQRKNPIRSATGNSSGSRLKKKFELVVVYCRSTPLVCSSFTTLACRSLAGPLLVKLFVPLTVSLNVPVTSPFDRLNVTFLTSPRSTADRNCVYVRLFAELLLLENTFVSANTPTRARISSHGSMRAHDGGGFGA